MPIHSLMTPKLIQESSSRLSREKWLMRALDILAEEHNALLRIDDLVKRMGVTKGSFYWHFKDRDDFLTQLLDYWIHEFNEKVSETFLNSDRGNGTYSNIGIKLIAAHTPQQLQGIVGPETI